MSIFMSICMILLVATIVNLFEAIRHQWAKENKYLAFIGPLIPIGLMLIKLWKKPFESTNFILIAIWFILIVIIVLLWKRVSGITEQYFAQEVAKDNILAKLDPHDVESSLRFLNEKERAFFLLYEFSETAILWFGLEEYLIQTSGVHLREVIDGLSSIGSNEISKQLSWYEEWHNSTPPFTDDEIMSMSELDEKITDINMVDPIEAHLEMFVSENASYLGVSEMDLHPDKKHKEKFYEARAKRQKDDKARYVEELHSGVLYETEKERAKRLKKEQRKSTKQRKGKNQS